MALGFLFADHQQGRDLGERMLAHLEVDLLVAQIDVGAQAGLAQRRQHLLGVVVAFRRNRGDDDLHRRQPQREVAGVVLDQDAGEALHRAADRAMHHHRRLLGAVGVDIERAEPLRQVEVDLRGAALPVAADRVAQHIFELRPVERAFARVDLGLDAVAALGLDLGQHRGHHALGVIPHLVGADALLRPGRQLHRQFAFEAEVGVGRQDQVVDLDAFLGELRLGAEHVRVVLGEAAHPHQAVHGARRLVAMHHAELGEPQRQIAVALQTMLEDLHVAGAVHRLQREPALVLGVVAGRLRGEHVLAVPLPVARGLPQHLVEDLRRVDLVVVAGEAAAHIADQRLEQAPALGVPEHHARTFFLEVEQVEFTAELAVVALLGFLDLMQVGVEVFLLGPGGAVDAGQHRIVAVAAPIRARHLHQLEGGADLAGRGHVRAAAQIEPLALLVDLDRLVFRNGVDQLDLERLAVVGEHLLGFVAGPDFLGERFVARDDLAHLLLDRREVFRGERLVAEEVVVEAVLDGRADGHLGARPQALHRFGEHVGAIVPDQFQRARIVTGDEVDLGIVFDRIGEIGQRAVQRHHDGALGERGRNALGDVEPGGAAGIFAGLAVGEGDGDLVHGGYRLEVGERVLEAGGGRGRLVARSLFGHRKAPLAHSCVRAQVSGKGLYSRGIGRFKEPGPGGGAHFALLVSRRMPGPAEF